MGGQDVCDIAGRKHRKRDIIIALVTPSARGETNLMTTVTLISPLAVYTPLSLKLYLKPVI